MKERYIRKQLPAILGILIAIGLVILVLLLHGIATAVNSFVGVSFMEYIEYVILIVLGIAIVRKWLTEYEYEVTEDSFAVNRAIGRRPRRIFECPTRHIIYIGRDKPSDTKGRITKLTYASGNKDKVYLTYIKNDEKRCAVFSPSEGLVEFIKSHTK
jgi:hypothetical protein